MTLSLYRMPRWLATLLLATALFTVFSQRLAASSAVFTNDVTISETDTNYDGQDIVVDGATVTVNGAHSFNSLLLTNNAVLTHSPCTPTGSHKLDLTFSN